MPRKLSLFLLIAVLLTGCAAPAATPAPAAPLTLTDVMGRTVTIAKTPETLVTTTATATEIVYALGAGDKLIGRDRYSTYPAEALDVEVIGAYTDLNLELITALDPDLIVAGDKIQTEPIEALSALGLTVLASDATGYADLENSIRLVAQAILPADEAQTRADALMKSISDTEARVADAVAGRERPKVYYSVSYGEYGDYTCGVGSYITDLIGMAGGECVSADVIVPWPTTSIEQIMSWDPDILVINGYPGDLEAFLALDLYKDLRAVKEGRVYMIDADLMSHAGPRMAEALVELARIFHPDAGV